MNTDGFGEMLDSDPSSISDMLLQAIAPDGSISPEKLEEIISLLGLDESQIKLFEESLNNLAKLQKLKEEHLADSSQNS